MLISLSALVEIMKSFCLCLAYLAPGTFNNNVKLDFLKDGTFFHQIFSTILVILNTRRIPGYTAKCYLGINVNIHHGVVFNNVFAIFFVLECSQTVLS